MVWSDEFGISAEGILTIRANKNEFRRWDLNTLPIKSLPSLRAEQIVGKAKEPRDPWAIGGNKLGSLVSSRQHTPAVTVRSRKNPNLLAVGFKDGTIELWDTIKLQRTAVLDGHNGHVYCLDFSADGETLASGGDDRLVKLWNVAFGQERAILRGHTGAVMAVAFLQGDRRLVTVASDARLKTWDSWTVPAPAR
jgi:WD40 repeat protein